MSGFSDFLKNLDSDVLRRLFLALMIAGAVALVIGLIAENIPHKSLNVGGGLTQAQIDKMNEKSKEKAVEGQSSSRNNGFQPDGYRGEEIAHGQNWRAWVARLVAMVVVLAVLTGYRYNVLGVYKLKDDGTVDNSSTAGLYILGIGLALLSWIAWKALIIIPMSNAWLYGDDIVMRNHYWEFRDWYGVIFTAATVVWMVAVERQNPKNRPKKKAKAKPKAKP